ncbi:MAG TPA: heat-inducible transcriptional repressor HrcA [Microbacteriaceae bacterium]|nr:heat-inducible transcriptional repressor HrcA [Microbacteriaceae bacterium]
MVSERGLEVLRVIVEDYVATREPVGSKAIVERHGFGVSSATIRNDMAALEEDGLIAAPHTSSGRIPTDKGYRAFVDQISSLRPLTSAQRHAIESFLGQAVDLDDVLARTVRLLSQLTSQVAVIEYPTLGVQRVRHVEILPLGATRAMTVLIADGGRVEQRIVDLGEPVEPADLEEVRARANAALGGLSLDEALVALDDFADEFSPSQRPLVTALVEQLREQVSADRQARLVMAGTANLARTEPDFPGSITPVLEAIEEQVTLLRLFSELEAEQHGIAVSIGHEHDGFGLDDTSVLAGRYGTPGGRSRLGVIGPTRMDYPGNIVAIRAVARYLSRLLGEQE